MSVESIYPPPTVPDGISPQEEPCRLWSLWAIMRRFHAANVTIVFKGLKESECNCTHLRAQHGGGAVPTREVFDHALDVFQKVKSVAAEFELDATRALAVMSLGHYGEEPGVDVSGLAADMRNLEGMLINDLSMRRYLRVPVGMSTYVDNPALLGPEVAKAFPSAQVDLTAAGNCVAADCNTAAVFHLMRAVEWGMRALAVHLGFRQLRTRRRAGAKAKITPVAFAQWELILDGLRERVDRRLLRLRPGKVKQRDQEFYYPALEDIRGMRDAWRHHVMHTRQTYTEPEAMAILDRVGRLMSNLATRVSEV
jgi:hypothetical protein